MLAAGELRVESGPELQQGGDAPVDGDLARAWRQRAADQLQERGLAGAVSPDDADRLAPMDVKVQCAQCLEVPVPAIAMPGIEQLKQPMVRLAIQREGLRQPANPDRDVRETLRIPCVLRGTTPNRASTRPRTEERRVGNEYSRHVRI